MKAQNKELTTGYQVTTIDGDRIIQTHYAVFPSGFILCATAYNPHQFGPLKPEDWSQSSCLPRSSEYIGRYYI